MERKIERVVNDSRQASVEKTSTEAGQRLIERTRMQSDANRYRFLLAAREKTVVDQVRRKTSFGNKTGPTSGTTTKNW